MQTLALLDALFAEAPVGLAFWDPELRYVRINPALAEINGLEVDAHPGRRPGELLGELGERVESLLSQVLETGRPVLFHPISGTTAADPGRERHWHASYYPVHDSDGEVAGVGAVVIETTAERDAALAAQAAQGVAEELSDLLDAVFAASPIGLGVWDPQVRYRRVNPALAELNGVPVDQHFGRRPEEIVGDMGRQIADAIERVLATGEPVQGSITGVVPARPDRQQTREVAYFPVHGAEGRVVAVGGAVRDVTERQAAEADRERLLREALTARAQAEAAQIRSRAAQEAAEAARAETEKVGRRLELLAAAGARMLRSMDLDTTMQEVAQLAVPALADWCGVTLVNSLGEPWTIAVAHVDPERVALAREMTARYPSDPKSPVGIGAVVRTGEPQVLPEVTSEHLEIVARDAEHLQMLRRLGMRSALIVPLKTPARVVGALTLVMSESGRVFEEDDISLAQSVANRAALAAENARLYAERSHIAQTLQRSLLPPTLPELPGVELAARYRAAGDQNEVGGDFYDLFRGADGVWVAIIGDVSGKGPEAAAVTSLTRHTLRAGALRETSPARNLRLLNEALLAGHDDSASRFATVVYARVRPGDDGVRVTVSTGGHLPPVVLRHDGTVEHVDVRGSLLGAVADVTLPEREVRLEPGDLLLLYTDGVTELRPREPSYGERLLLEGMRGLAGRSAEAVVDAVEQLAVDAQDGAPRDDIALLALRARPRGDV